VKRWLGDASGAVADIGVLVPISAALILGNGLDAATVFVGAGLLYLVAGLYFRVPVPVQPIKAAAAIAIARQLPPETIAAAGMVLGALLVILGATGAARHLARVFTPPIIRGLQLGVGLILLKTALDLATPGEGRVGVLVAVGIAVALAGAARWREPVPLALLLVIGGGIVAVIAGAGLPGMEMQVWVPQLEAGAFDLSVLATAFTLLVIPQIPLTFGNAVIAVVDLEHRYFPESSARVNPLRVSLSAGAANMTVGALGGMPMCHGSGGLTAHYRAGARTFHMNIVIGVALLILGVFFGPVAVAVLALIPVAVLAGLLAFTGLFHSSLVASLRGLDLVVASAMGVIGLLTTNLALALGVGLVLHWSIAAATGRSALEPART
jgi:sulfate permease, SulP family